MTTPTIFLNRDLAPRALTAQTIFNHIMSGQPLGIYIPSKGYYLDHIILGMTIESGFTPPAKPTCFNLTTNHGQIFVRTLA